jgi:hypothetical protein
MDRHGIGGNAPPLAERLEIDHASLAAQADEAAALVPDELAPVASDEDAGAYAETAKALKGVASIIEAARKKEKDQILKDGRTIDSFFAAMADKVKKAADRVIAEINQFQRIKLEAERKAAKEREEAERKAAALFDETPPAPVTPVVVKEAARVTSITGAKASASTKWVHRVTEPEKVPREYLMVNEAAIKAAVSGGTRHIPGVEIYEDVRTAIR